VPQPGGPSFDRFDIVSRDTSPDFVLTERRVGRATLALGPDISFRGERLSVETILGGEYTVGNYAALQTPAVIDNLVG
jgi:hypothetical protein